MDDPHAPTLPEKYGYHTSFVSHLPAHYPSSHTAGRPPSHLATSGTGPNTQTGASLRRCDVVFFSHSRSRPRAFCYRRSYSRFPPHQIERCRSLHALKLRYQHRGCERNYYSCSTTVDTSRMVKQRFRKFIIRMAVVLRKELKKLQKNVRMQWRSRMCTAADQNFVTNTGYATATTSTTVDASRWSNNDFENKNVCRSEEGTQNFDK